MDIISIIVLTIVTLLIAYALSKGYKFQNNTINIAAKILNSSISEVGLGSGKSVDGYYKSRKIIFKILPLREQPLRLKIIPHNIVKKQKKIAIDHPKPTKETFLAGNEINYYPYPLLNLNFSFYHPFTEQELIDIFEELTKAAKIVESGENYYRE